MSKTLKEWREEWLAQFDLEQDNYGGQQLCDLTWDVTAFEMFSEAVRLAPNDTEEGGKKLNWFVFDLLSRSYTKSVMSSIRRLVDDDGRTNSLTRMLGEMQRNGSEFTRA